MTNISRRGVFGAGAAAAAGLVPAASASPAAEATTNRRRIRSDVLRVASFNIHYGAGADNRFDLRHTAEMIEAIDADIIGLQEVDRHFRDRSEWLDTIGELASMLNLHHAYGPNIDLDPLEPGAPRRQYGCALLSAWPVSNVRNTRLPQHPDSEPRGLLEADVRVAGTRLRFATTHMQHTSDVEWQEQADAIAEAIDGFDGPYILVGDTNAVPDSPGTATFTDRLDDVWAQVGVGDGLTAANTWRFDYIFVPRGSDIRSAWLVSTDASDHLPLVADVTLTKPNG